MFLLLFSWLGHLRLKQRWWMAAPYSGPMELLQGFNSSMAYPSRRKGSKQDTDRARHAQRWTDSLPVHLVRIRVAAPLWVQSAPRVSAGIHGTSFLLVCVGLSVILNRAGLDMQRCTRCVCVFSFLCLTLNLETSLCAASCAEGVWHRPRRRCLRPFIVRPARRQKQPDRRTPRG
jgi:hypothetical protein